MPLTILSNEEIQTIHQATLKVLAESGVHFWNSDNAIELFKAKGCKTDGYRVYFHPELLDECLSTLPDRNQLTLNGRSFRQGEVNFALIGNPYYLYEYEKSSYRDCEYSDLPDKIKMIEALDNYGIDVCYLIFRSKLDLKHHPDPVPGEPEKSYFTHYLCWCNPISPLQYQNDEVELIIKMSREKGPGCYVMLAPEVMMGATGPVTFAGALVQQNAEILAGVMLAQLAQPGVPCIYGSVGGAMDMRNGEFLMGTMEANMMGIASVQLADFYKLPSRISPGNTGAREPGIRAAVDLAMGLYVGAAAGGNFITTGLLDCTLMMSYEHLVIANELMTQVKRAVKPINMDADHLALDVIKEEITDTPNFMGNPHTREHMREALYVSDFTGRVEDCYEDWYLKANKKVKEILGRD